jgi:hypothetical protein
MQAESSDRDQTTPASGDDESSDSWETVHVTPLTAARDLASITTSRCFVLHSNGGLGNVPLQPLFHTAAGAAAADNTKSLSNTIATGGITSFTVPSGTDAPGALWGPSKRAAATSSGVNTAEKETTDAPGSAHVDDGSFTGAGRSLFERFVYRRVRVIRNTVPCLIRCATEAGPQLLPPQQVASGPHNSSNMLGSVSVVSDFASPSTAVVATAPTSSLPSLPHHHQRTPHRLVEQSSSSFMQTSFPSVQDPNVGLPSPLPPPPQPQQPHGSSTSKQLSPAATPQSTTQQLQQLTSAYTRSTLRRMSKASSRRSHASSSTLPESVIFLDPLEIIADAAISFVGVVFAGNVTVKGSGPVQFVNCCFGHRSTAQLCQQFVADPVAPDAAVGGKTDSDEAQRRTYSKPTEVGDLVAAAAGDVNDTGEDSSDDSGQLSGRTDSAAGAAASAAEDLPLASCKNHPSTNGNKPPTWTSPLRASGESGSLFSGPHTVFALPTAMRVMGVRQCSVLTSSAAGSLTSADVPRRKRLSSATPSRSTQSTFCAATTTSIQNSAMSSVLDVCGDSCCVLSQCDLYGGYTGASLVCHDTSRVSVTDSSFDGPSITWAAVEVRDGANALIQFTNIQQVMGVGVLVTDHGNATVDSSVIERCGIAGVVATDDGIVNLVNTGIEASISGVCVSLSGSAAAQMRSCNFTTRFPLPHRAAGMMFIDHLQSLNTLRGSKTAAGLTTPAQESIVSTPEEVLLQHALHADLESLLGLWLLHVGAADVAFPTSSQSLVLCDSAAAVVSECEFNSAMRLPDSSLSPTTTTMTTSGGNGYHNAADGAVQEENTSSSNSRANRSDCAVPSFTGLLPAAASVVAVVLTGSEPNLSVTNSRGLGSSGHMTSYPFLFPGSSATRRLPGVPDEVGMRRSLTHAARRSGTTFSENADGVRKDDETSPLRSGLARNASRHSVDATGTAEAAIARLPAAAAAVSSSPTPPVTQLHSGTGGARVPPHIAASTAGFVSSPASSLLPLPVRRVVVGLLSSYVMAREVFGENLAERRRAYAARTAAAPSSDPTNAIPSSPLMRDGEAAAGDPRRTSAGDKKCTTTELFLSFEALMEIDEKDDEEGKTTESTSFTSTVATGRRLSNLPTAAMQSLQDSLQQLGCLSMLMSPSGGVYHIVASHQASLMLTFSVLSLALPPQLMVKVPNAWASAASPFGGTGGLSSTIRNTAPPFVAAVLDYRELDETAVSAASANHARDAPTSTAATAADERRKGETQHSTPSNPHNRQQFCSIFTRSNVIQYECVSLANSLGNETRSTQPTGKATTTTGGGAHQQECRTAGGQQQQQQRTTTGHTGTDDDDDDDKIGESSTVHSIWGAGVSGGGSYNSSIKRKSPGGGGAEGETPGGKSDAHRAGGVTGPRGGASLPPRPSSASTSAAQLPPHLDPQRPQRAATQCADGNDTSSTAVEFNTAAWGLVLVTPQVIHNSDHSAAVDAVVRTQVEQWCRVELMPSQPPPLTQGCSREASSTPTPGTGREGPLEVPTPLLRSTVKTPGRSAATVASSSRSASESTRAAGGSANTVTGRLKLDSVDYAESSQRACSGATTATTTASYNTIDGMAAHDTQNLQVHHLGNIFLNMANPSELLGVTHPEHICTTFANFAHVMELPAAQDYPLSSSPVGLSSNLTPATSSTQHSGTGISTHVVAANAKAALAAVAGDIDAPGCMAKRPFPAQGNRTAATATTSTVNTTSQNAAPPLTAATATPTNGATHGGFQSSLLSEREANWMQANADMQRQMLLDDIDAPPLLAAVVAAAAGRDDGNNTHHTHESTLGGGTANSLLRSTDGTRVDATHLSSASSQPSNRSPPAPESITAAAIANAAADCLVEYRLDPALSAAVATAVAKVETDRSAHGSWLAHPTCSPSIEAASTADTGATGSAVVAAGPFMQPQGGPHTGIVQAPTPPKLDILEVESVDFSSSSCSSSSSNSSSSDGNSSSTSHSEISNATTGLDVGASNRHSSSSSRERLNGRDEQPAKRAKWTLPHGPSTDSLRSPTISKGSVVEVEGNGESGRGAAVQGGSSEVAQLGITDAKSHYDADLIHVSSADDDESPAPGSPSAENTIRDSSSSTGDDTPEDGGEEVARKAEEQQFGSPLGTSVCHLRPSLSAISRPSASQLSQSTSQQLSHVPLPEFQLSPSNTELLPASRQTVTDTPLAVYVTSATSTSFTTKSSPPHSPTSSSSSVASKPERVDHANQAQQQNVTCAVVTHESSAPEPSPTVKEEKEEVVAQSPGGQNATQSRSMSLVQPVHTVTLGAKAVHGGGTENTNDDTETGVAAAVAAMPAAVVVGVPVMLEAAFERMALIEEQLLQMQRLMQVQQAQIAPAHTTLQQSSSSQPEMCIFDNQPSLLVLPPTMRSTVDVADHTQGATSSKDSRPTQSSSYRSSFSTSKVHSASGGSHATPNQTTHDSPFILVPGDSGGSAAREGGTRPHGSIGQPAAVPLPLLPKPPTHPLEKPENAERRCSNNAAASTAAAAGGEQLKASSSSATAEEEDNGSDNDDDGSDAVQVTPNTASAPPSHYTSPPAQTVPAPQPAVARSAAPAAVITPSPPLTPPPNTAQCPASRSRLRHLSTGTTLEVLVAAAQQSLLGGPLTTSHDVSVVATAAAAATAALPGNDAIEVTNGAGYSTSLNELQHPPRSSGGSGGEAADEEERRWQEALLRRLQSTHFPGGDGGGAGRWRERLPSVPSAGATGGGGGGLLLQRAGPRLRLRRCTTGSEGVEGWADEARGGEGAGPGGGGDADDSNELLQCPWPDNATVAYEPWRTTVATGTRYAHRPPPHPYSFPQQPSSSLNPPQEAATTTLPGGGEPPYDGSYEQPLRWRGPVLPPPLPSGTPFTPATSSSARSPRTCQPRRTNAPPVSYIESSANSSQLSPTVLYPAVSTSSITTTASANASAAPPGLYLTGRRRSRHPPSSSPARPSHHTPSSLARLHEDHLHDQYARAAWNALLEQSKVQQREQQRLTSLQQSAQVYRLYTEPMRDRVQRATSQGHPTREQLYRLHGCTFTPKINASRTVMPQLQLQQKQQQHHQHQRSASVSQRRRSQRNSMDVLIDSLPHANSTLLSNDATISCNKTTTSTHTQRSQPSQHRWLPPR